MGIKLLEVFSKCKQLRKFEINGLRIDLEGAIEFLQRIIILQ
jgi:hypothetical protein